MSATTLQGVGSIWGDSTGEVFALGYYGILHHDGSTWTKTGLFESGADIWGTSADDVFVVGSRGSISHYSDRTWREMTSPTSQALHAVWGSAANDVYAVGESSTILHYDGQAWTLASPPGSNTETFRDVWGSSSSDVYVITSDRVYHYNGLSWSVRLESGGTVIWGNASDDVFIAGSNGAIHHYDGQAWTRFDTGIQSDIVAAWGSSSNNMYFVGECTVFHWDGFTCSESLKLVASDPLNDNEATWLGAIWGRSATDLYVGGSEFRHYDGTRWTQTLGLIFGGGIAAVGPVSDSGFLTATRPSTDYWETYSYDGIEWKYLGDFYADMSINDIWGSSFSDIFVAGTHGNDGGSEEDGYDDGYIWRYDGVHWRLSASAPRGLIGLWGTSGDDVFAVGVAGLILHYNGSSWSEMPSGTTSFLGGVWGFSSTDVYAVGSDESGVVILHYDGSAWSEFGRYPAPYYHARKIWGTSDHDVFVLNYYGGTPLHYDGTSWTTMRFEGTYQILDIGGRSADDLYALTDRVTLHYDGSDWRALDTGVEFSIRRILATRTDLYGFEGGGVYRLGPR